MSVKWCKDLTFWVYLFKMRLVSSPHQANLLISDLYLSTFNFCVLVIDWLLLFPIFNRLVRCWWNRGSCKLKVGWCNAQCSSHCSWTQQWRKAELQFYNFAILQFCNFTIFAILQFCNLANFCFSTSCISLHADAACLPRWINCLLKTQIFITF